MLVLGFAKSLPSLEALHGFFWWLHAAWRLFSIVFRLCWALVLGLFQLFLYVLGVSFVVDVSSGCVSVLGASVLCCCRWSGRTGR